MIKNIIREVSPESCEFSFYFDDDGMRDYDGTHHQYENALKEGERMKKIIAIIAATAAIIALTVTVTVNACFTHCNVYSESPVTIEFYGHTWEHNAQED